MKKLKFAVIGVNGIGKRHIEGVMENKDAELIGICDCDKEVLDKVANIYSITNKYLDYHDLLNKDVVDAVCLCTPDQIHKDMVVEFLNAGIHVLCEKPLALNLDDCKAMVEAELRSTAQLMVGQVCRKTPGFIKAKEIVDSGLIGNLMYVESEYAHDYSHMPLHWRNDADNPRHPVTGGGCHPVDLLRWIAGNPTEVFSYANKKSLDDTWPCDDTAIAVLKFPNDVMGKVFISTGAKRDYTMRTALYGNKGTIITDNTNSTLTLYLQEFGGMEKFLGTNMEDIAIKIPISINNHNVKAEIDEFVNFLMKEQPVDIPGREGAASVAVCEAIIESSKSGKAEKVKYL